MNEWRGHGRLTMNGTHVTCRAEAGKIWLGFDPLEICISDVPTWADSQFSAKAIAAANAGPDNGYQILEWPLNFPLASLPTPGAILTQHTQRALIVTCAIDPATALLGENIQYRYFAPQHGVSEDSATGSAMRVLASYWQQRGLGDVLTAYQNSDAGGLLFSDVRAGKIWVGGCTSPAVNGVKDFE